MGKHYSTQQPRMKLYKFLINILQLITIITNSMEQNTLGKIILPAIPRFPQGSSLCTQDPISGSNRETTNQIHIHTCYIIKIQCNITLLITITYIIIFS